VDKLIWYLFYKTGNIETYLLFRQLKYEENNKKNQQIAHADSCDFQKKNVT